MCFLRQYTNNYFVDNLFDKVVQIRVQDSLDIYVTISL